MPGFLEGQLQQINWNDHVSWCLGQTAAIAQVERAAGLVATWADVLRGRDPSNRANAFLNEMQVQVQQCAALLALALYRPSVAASRAMVESALYYTYFRHHPVELSTIARQKGERKDWYIDKSFIIEFHQRHVAEFESRQQAVSFISALEIWYRKVSGLVHSQVPGQMVAQLKLADLKPDRTFFDEAVARFDEGARVVNQLFLVTLGSEVWHDVDQDARCFFLAGIPRDRWATLGLI